MIRATIVVMVLGLFATRAEAEGTSSRCGDPTGGAPAPTLQSAGEACGAGDRDGCLRLAMLHQGRWCGPRDDARALEAATRGCELGSGDACAWAAVMALRGEGRLRDLGRAVALFRRACDHDQADGCFFAADSQAMGVGVREDRPGAATWFRRACDLGSWEACGRLKFEYREWREPKAPAAMEPTSSR